MPNWDREEILEEERLHDVEKHFRMPFGAQMNAISPETENGIFSHPGNSAQAITITHPFMSRNSWIRAMPEYGANFVMTFRADEAKPQIISPISRGAKARIANYRDGNNLYRPLIPGEINLRSKGQTEIYMSRRPILDIYGGALKRWVDQDKLMVGDRAPLHHRQGFQYKSNVLGDEERFGILTRPKENEDGTLSSWERKYPKIRGGFTAEHYMSLLNPNGSEPKVLFTRQSGHVLNQRGFPIGHSRTGINLRHIEEYFDNSDTSSKIEIDEAGNYSLTLSDKANVGYELTTRKGAFRRTVGLDERANIKGDMMYNVQKNVIFRVGETLRFNIGGLFELQSRGGGQRMQWSDVAGETKFALTTGAGQSFIIDDTDGNTSINLIHAEGSRLTMSPNGSVKVIGGDGSNLFMNAFARTASLTSGFGTYMSLANDVRLVSGNQALIFDGLKTAQLQSNLNILMTAPKLDVQAGSIALGALASFSATLAEPLALLFDSHIHASPVGPTSPPLPPNTAALINANPLTSFAASFVKLKGNLI